MAELFPRVGVVLVGRLLDADLLGKHLKFLRIDVVQARLQDFAEDALFLADHLGEPTFTLLAEQSAARADVTRFDLVTPTNSTV